jgi:hypothetical protein
MFFVITEPCPSGKTYRKGRKERRYVRYNFSIFLRYLCYISDYFKSTETSEKYSLYFIIIYNHQINILLSLRSLRLAWRLGGKFLINPDRCNSRLPSG